MVHCCCAYGCSAKFEKGSGLGFFRFPLQKSRRIQWTLAVRRKDFVPNSSTRICGKHFITGRPSKDIKHPDYVPTVFSDRNVVQKKGFKRKVLCEFEELPVISTNFESNSCEESDETVSCDESLLDGELEEADNGKIRRPEFKPEIENSPLINDETIKRILESDAARNPSNAPAEPLSAGQRFSPRLFTFIDVTGRTIARFTEKRVRKNARYPEQHPLVPPKYPIETVQVIIDKKRAKTVAVDRRAICISNTPELCCKNKAKKTCIMNISGNCPYPIEVKSEPNSELETISIKSEPESDLETEQTEEDYVNFFSELKDYEQQDNCFGIKIQDVVKVLT